MKSRFMGCDTDRASDYANCELDYEKIYGKGASFAAPPYPAEMLRGKRYEHEIVEIYPDAFNEAAEKGRELAEVVPERKGEIGAYLASLAARMGVKFLITSKEGGQTDEKNP